MAWKNLKQRSLAESMLIEYDALKERDDVHELITWSRIEILLSDIHAKTKGEKAWSPLMMFKARMATKRISMLMKMGSSSEAIKDKVLGFINYLNQTMAKPFKWTY